MLLFTLKIYMNELTINKEKVAEVYQNASAETREALKTLFGDESNFMSNPKPTLDDYTTIRSYEDACEALGEEPLPYEPNPIMNLYGVDYEVPPHIIALMKLETISRALWGKTWKTMPDAEGSACFYYPVFTLYTKSEIEDMDKNEREGLLSANVYGSATMGFGYLLTHTRNEYALANSGLRLCQETREKAWYFGNQFLELWAEYLKFNFEVGGRLK